MDQLLLSLSKSIIVSCQAEGSDPFNEDPEYMALFARAAIMGGARGIRTQGIEKLCAIKRCVSEPIIGLLKSEFPDGSVRITCSYKEVEELISAGSDIIAIDGTFRLREGLSGPEFIKEVKKRYNCIVLADIATLDEALECEKAGADCISTTLNGYTPDTKNDSGDYPNYELLKKTVERVKIPVFAEGRYNTPLDARRAIEIGAFAVIVGSAITRPRVITSWFANSINNIKI